MIDAQKLHGQAKEHLEWLEYLLPDERPEGRSSTVFEGTDAVFVTAARGENYDVVFQTHIVPLKDRKHNVFLT